jgi:hypothetical protein
MKRTRILPSKAAVIASAVEYSAAEDLSIVETRIAERKYRRIAETVVKKTVSEGVSYLKSED